MIIIYIDYQERLPPMGLPAAVHRTLTTPTSATSTIHIGAPGINCIDNGELHRTKMGKYVSTVLRDSQNFET